MARIRRANVTLNVDDSEVDYYVNLGYNVIDESGSVIKESIPNDVRTLQRYYLDSKKKIAELEAEIAKLKEGSTSTTKGRKTKE